MYLLDIQKIIIHFSSMLGDNVAFRPAKKELLERLPIGVSSVYWESNQWGVYGRVG